MLNKAAKPLVKLVDRYLPDPYIFVLLLTLVVLIAAVVAEHKTPLEVISYWGDGFWTLLSFSMQMLLVLVAGFMLASSPPIKKLLDAIAGLAKSAPQAIMLVTLVSLAASWINWGFGLVVGALFAKALARKVKVDYRLLVASAYAGFVVWHGGLAGSIPLTIATAGHFTESQIGIIPTSETIFASFNLLLVAVLFVVMPLVNRFMLPEEKDSIYVDPKVLNETGVENVPTMLDADSGEGNSNRPADKLENSRLLGWSVGGAGLVYLGYYFWMQGGSLNLNLVNFLFLFLAILLHQTPRSLLTSLNEAIKGGAGIVIQFPLLCGHYGGDGAIGFSPKYFGRFCGHSQRR